MDHLPAPQNPVRALPDVPYICEQVYDGGPFSAYPRRMGLTWKDVVGESIGITMSQHERASFMQTWLFFGAIDMLFGSFFCPYDFIRTDRNGRRLITTKILTTKVDEFIHRTRRSPEGFFQKLDEIDGNLNLHSVAYSRQKVVEEHMPVFVSIALVGILLRATRLAIREQSSAVLDKAVWEAAHVWVPRSPGLTSGFKVDVWIHQLCVGSGWCPSRVAKIRNESIEEVLYLAQISPKDAQDHRQCDKQVCRAKQSGLAAHPVHVSEDCNCDLLRADVDELDGTCTENALAIIPSDACYGKTTGLKMRGLATYERYVAISHVWRDGLGCATDNAVWQCQLSRISSLVRRLYNGDNVPFWLDTLCCPVRPGLAKQKVLQSMRSVYANADKVLVISSEMMEIEGDPDPRQVFLMLQVSGWASRLWTLQEGFVAQRLCIQLKEKAVDLDSIAISIFNGRPLVEPDRGSVLDHSFTVFAMSVYIQIRGQRSGLDIESRSSPVFGDLLRLMWALNGRSVSIASDEALCLGVLMGLGLKSIVEAQPEDRMCMFWKALPSIPRSLIFFDYEQLPIPGFRWAPSTLLSKISPIFWTDLVRNLLLQPVGSNPDSGVITSDGLKMKSWGVLLDRQQPLPFLRKFFLTAPADDAAEASYEHWVMEVVVRGHEPLSMTTKILGVEDEENVPGQVAIAILEDLDLDSPNLGDQTLHGILLYQVENRDGVLHARRGEICALKVIGHPENSINHTGGEVQQYASLCMTDPTCWPEEWVVDGLDAYAALPFQELGPDQEWCFD